MNFQTTASSQMNRPQPQIHTVGTHTVVHSAFEDVILPDAADITILTPPAIDDTWTQSDYEMWIDTKLIPKLNSIMKQNAVCIQISSNKRGDTWFKAAMTATLLQKHGWNAFRQIIWKRYKGNFHRARYAFVDVYIFRRGNRPSNKDSSIRYKDIIEIPAVKGDADGVLPMELIQTCLQLFLKPGDVVLDAFAGTGTVAYVCHTMNVPSISIEIDETLVKTILKQLEGVPE